jgi:hypothetical protein
MRERERNIDPHSRTCNQKTQQVANVLSRMHTRRSTDTFRWLVARRKPTSPGVDHSLPNPTSETVPIAAPCGRHLCETKNSLWVKRPPHVSHPTPAAEATPTLSHLGRLFSTHASSADSSLDSKSRFFSDAFRRLSPSLDGILWAAVEFGGVDSKRCRLHRVPLAAWEARPSDVRNTRLHMAHLTVGTV